MPTNAKTQDAVLEAKTQVLLGIPALQSDLGRDFLNAYEAAILASRDTAWRAAIEGMRKPHDPLCMLNAPMGYVPADGAECDCSVADWNAALSALADRMTEKPNE